MRKILLLAMPICTASAGCTVSIDESVRNLGFSVLKPASTIDEPGLIVQQLSASPVQLELVCSTLESTYGQTIKPKTGPLPSGTWSQKRSITAKLDASYLTQINGDLQANLVKSVSLNLRNPQILAVSGDQVINALLSTRPSPGCLQSLQQKLSAGRKISVVGSVLQADYTYSITFDNNALAHANVSASQATKNVAASLGVSAENAGSGTITGEGLFWGVKDDPDLLQDYLTHTGLAQARGIRMPALYSAPLPRAHLLTPQDTVVATTTVPAEAPRR